jgi:hypothetical protein
MNVFLDGPTHLEIEIKEASSLDDARERLSLYRTMLYLNGITPFVLPFLATHSVNAYSGINDRDHASLREKLPEGMREGITSDTATVEAWEHELSLRLKVFEQSEELTSDIIRKASWMAKQWAALERKHTELKAVRYALETAPRIEHIGSSLLHIWIGLESFFPNVRSEVSFRITLLLAELCSSIKSAGGIYDIAKRSYTDRSNAAHGNLKHIGGVEWGEAWKLLCDCMLAVIQRNNLPDESGLISSLLRK